MRQRLAESVESRKAACRIWCHSLESPREIRMPAARAAEYRREVNTYEYRTDRAGRTGRRAGVVDAAAPAGPGGTLGRGDHARFSTRPRSSATRWPPARRRCPLLAGKTCVNLFFENSTRTRTSFSLAARRLGADTVDFSASTSSLSKGETFIDTAKNIEAMGVDAMVVRHRTPGTPHLLAAEPRLLGDQRRRRAARASHPGPARHPDHPPAAGPDRRADRGPGRRHRPQPHRPVEHLGPQEARRPRDRLRPVDAGLAALGRARRRSTATASTTILPRVRRAEPAADPVRAAVRRGRSPRSASTPSCTR